MSRRIITLEDIGRKAVEASVATTTWRALRGAPCETPEAGEGRCPETGAYRGRCDTCLRRLEARADHRRAKNSLLVAIRSYIRRTPCEAMAETPRALP